MKHYPGDLEAVASIKKGARFRMATKGLGYACGIMAGNRTVLHLNPGTVRNQYCLPKIIKALNEWSESK